MLEFSTDFFELPEALINEVDAAVSFFKCAPSKVRTSASPGARVNKKFLKHNSICGRVKDFFYEIAEGKVKRDRHSQAAVRWKEINCYLMKFDELINLLFYRGEENDPRHFGLHSRTQADLEKMIVRAFICGIARQNTPCNTTAG